MSDADELVGRTITGRSWVPSPTPRQLILASIRIRARILQATRERRAGASSTADFESEEAV